MVGQLGDTALAATGQASFLHFVAAAIVMGFSAGVQAVVSRRLGEGKLSEAGEPLTAALVAAISFGVPWSIFVIWLAPHAVPHMNANPLVADDSTLYLQLRAIGIMAIGCNFAFRGFWNGIQRPGLYLRTLVFMHICNIILNWLLIFGNLGAPEMGAPGAGLASGMSAYIGLAYYLYLGSRYGRDAGFLKKKPRKSVIATVLRLSIPTCLQSFFFAGGLTALFWIIGRGGEQNTAAASVLINIMLLGILPCVGLGLACASLVGEALGKGDPADAKRWGWDVTRVAFVFLIFASALMLFMPRTLLAPFLSNPETLELAVAPLRVFGAGVIIDGAGIVIFNALLGAGYTLVPSVVSTTLQWLVCLPLVYFVGVTLDHGLLGMWIVQTSYGVTKSLIFAWLWHRGKWADVKV